MRARTLGYAAAAGLASFLVTFVAVSELLLRYVEFSVLVGIPAGLVVGAVVTAFVLTRLGGPDRTHRGVALAIGTFGVVFLLVFVVAAGASLTSVTLSLAFAAVVGVLGGVGAFVWHRRQAPGRG